MERETPLLQLTARTPTNIAVIKYWGKRDLKLNLPINSSVSITLNTDDLATTTTATASHDYQNDALFLNGVEEDVTASKRMLAVFSAVRACAGDVRDSSGAILVSREQWKHLKVRVVSENNFPTAAGLASSAAGYAALTYCLAQLMNANLVGSPYGDLSCIARMGSGSACRSLAGGFVAWDMGSRADGADSAARQGAPASHWPELQVLILVVSDKKKTVSSTAGMVTSVETSPLLAHRAAAIVPERMSRMEAAYLARDFPAFARLTMEDSNQFHATCLDTHPPVFYLNDVSRSIIGMVHAFNEAVGEVRLGYTFDAGPNAVLVTLGQHMPQVLAAVLAAFPPPLLGGAGYVSRPALHKAAKATAPPADFMAAYRRAPDSAAVRYLYHTNVGPGAAVLDPSKPPAGKDGLPLKRAPGGPSRGTLAAIFAATAVVVATARARRRS